MKTPCPVCGKNEIESSSDLMVCPTCGWIRDPVQEEDENCYGCTNIMSLKQAREAYARGERVR